MLSIQHLYVAKRLKRHPRLITKVNVCDGRRTYNILFASKPTSLRVGSADGRPLYPFRHPTNSLDNFTGLMDSPRRSIDPQFCYFCVWLLITGGQITARQVLWLVGWLSQVEINSIKINHCELYLRPMSPFCLNDQFNLIFYYYRSLGRDTQTLSFKVRGSISKKKFE